MSLCRMERLQRVVSKVQMESGVCEEQLSQVEALLQTVREAPAGGGRGVGGPGGAEPLCLQRVCCCCRT